MSDILAKYGVKTAPKAPQISPKTGGILSKYGVEMAAPTPPEEAPLTPTERALDIGGKAIGALDYPAGVARTAIAESPQGKLLRGATALALGGEQPQPLEAGLLEALKGQAPGVESYLAQAGVPKGPEVAGITPRGAAGFVGEAALDPLNVLGVGAARKAGKAIYKSAFKEADKVASRFGKRMMPSDVLLEEGITGTANQVAKKSVTQVNKYGKAREALVAEADAMGAVIDNRTVFAPAAKKISQWLSSPDPNQQRAAKKGMKFLEDYAKEIPAHRRNNLTVSEALQMKSNIYDDIGEAGYDTLRSSRKGKELMRDLGRGFRQATEEAVESSTGKGDVLIDLNERMGSLLTATKTLNKKALKGLRKNVVTKIDLLSMAYSPKMTLFGKIADAMKSSWVRTKAGKAIRDVAPVAEPALRRSLINLQREE